MDHQKYQYVKQYQDVTSELEMIDKAIHTTRALTIELNPPLLRTQGLDAALRWLQTHGTALQNES
jgi:signal transduction histidine kinase